MQRLPVRTQLTVVYKLYLQGAFNHSLLPAFEKLSRTRHGAASLESKVEMIRQAELVSLLIK